MRELTYPTLPISDLFAVKPTSHTLWRWLPASLALHALFVMAWELTNIAQLNMELPIQSGQQSVHVRLVSASILPSEAAEPEKTKIDSIKTITTVDATQSIADVSTKPIMKKSTQKAETKKTANNTAKTNTDSTQLALANLPEGVYSEAMPQSSNKPEYPRMAILKNQQGKVVIKLDIDERGQTHNIEILKSSGFTLLDKAVITFAQMERFIPANSNNSPVKTTQQYSFLFKLI